MKSNAVPLTCSIALTAMMAAGLSQWWSVNQLVLAVGGTMPKRMHVAAPSPAVLAKMESKTATTPAIPAQNSPRTQPASEKFFESMVNKLSAIEQQNKDLRDQLAETNRDMMEVQFRLDSHSESFRPLKIAPEPDTTTIDDDGPGVLPPRAIPTVEESLGQ